MKRDYGLKVFSRAYEEVDLVYILDTATVKGKCRKLRTSWGGARHSDQEALPISLSSENQGGGHGG